MSQQYGPGQGPAGQGGPGPQYPQPLPPPGYGGRPPVQGPPPGAYGGPPAGYGGTPGQGGPSQGGPGQGGPGQGGWGPGGYPPGQFQRPRRAKRIQRVVMAGGALAVVLIILGVVLLVRSGGKDNPQPTAGDTVTPAPVGTLYTPPTPSPTETEVTRGPNDKGVEIGGGVWFTPAAGWVKDSQKRSGASYVLPEPGRPGAIDAYFWVRQTEFMGAKAFADHLVDVESNNLQHVVIGNGHYIKCPSPALKTCYATNYSAVIPGAKGKPPVIFSGFIQAFEDGSGQTTATDSALQTTVYQARKQDVRLMNESLVRSF